MTRIKRILHRGLGLEYLDREDARGVVAWGVALASVAVGLRFFFWAYTGRVWEDALITILHSENLVNGLGLTHYRTGQPPLHGFTSPLSVLIPLMGDVFRAGYGLFFIRIASAFAGGLTVLYAMGIAIHPRTRLPGPLAVLVMGYLACEHHQILWGMAGMETQMATLVLLMSIYFTITVNPVALGISLGLCMLARPDFAFWTLIVGAYLLIFERHAVVRTTLVAVVVYLPWIVAMTAYYGSPIPNTIVAKGLGNWLWTSDPNLMWYDILSNIVARVTGAYNYDTVFQPLGPSFGGHGHHFRVLVHDGGWISQIMTLLALLSAAAVVVRRQWAWLPPILFVVVYAIYYVFLVPGVFSWYVIPYVAVVILLSVRGISAAANLLSGRALRTVVLTLLTVAYLFPFIAYLPKTFTTEKRIQQDIENQVRRKVGEYLGQVMGKDQSVGCEPLGYVAYYSRRTVYDWPGLANREVVEYSKNHRARKDRKLMPMLDYFRPDFLVLRYSEYTDNACEKWIEENYKIINSFEVDPHKTADIFEIKDNVDLGFFVLAKKKLPDGPGINPRHTRGLYAAGLRCHWQGKTAEAIAYFLRALQEDPQYVEAHNNYGMTLLNAGRVVEAMAKFDEALRIDPTFPMAHNNRAFALLQQGNPDGALVELREALRLDPDYPEAHKNLGSLLASLGDLKGALEHFQAAAALKPEDVEARKLIESVQAALAAKEAGNG